MGDLAGDAGQASASQVLHAAQEALLVDLQTGVDEGLFGNGVPQLHSAPVLLLRLLGEHGGGEGHTVDAIAPGPSSDQDEHVAGSLDGAEDHLLPTDDAKAAHVDYAIANIARVEEEASRHGGDAYPVAVIADACHHSREEVLGVLHAHGQIPVSHLQGAEVQGVDQRHWLGTHAQHVADDATDPRGGPAVRLDRTGVVVALDAKGIRPLVIHRHHTCVVPGDDVGCIHHKDMLLQVVEGALVTAVLRPCLPQSLEFHVRGVTPLGHEVLLDAFQLLHGQTQGQLLADYL